MGFNKKYISIDTLQKYIDNGCPIWKVFDSDALFFCDSKSVKIYDLFFRYIFMMINAVIFNITY